MKTLKGQIFKITEHKHLDWV